MADFGIYLNGLGGNYQEAKELWIAAEELGYDYLWMMDNIVGPEPYTPEAPVLDTWSVLPVIAEVTKKVKFGPLVSPFSRRHPSVLAKSSSIVDQISNGRLQLAMGPGDEPQQHLPWGQPYPEKPSERIAILREELDIIRRMWTEKHVTFDGQYYQLKNAVNEPKPVQKPHPPIWIGLIFGKKLMPRIAAEFADHINVYNADDDHVRDLLAIAKMRYEEAGRDFSTVKLARNVGVKLVDGEFDFDAFIEDCARQGNRTAEYTRNNFDVYECFIAGNDEEVARTLKRRVFDLGFDQAIVELTGGAGGYKPGGFTGGEYVDYMLNNMRRFRERVVPLVKEMLNNGRD